MQKKIIGLITAKIQKHIFRFLGSGGFGPPSYGIKMEINAAINKTAAAKMIDKM